MEYSLNDIHKFTLFARTTPINDSGDYQFVHEGNIRTTNSNPQFDFYIPVFLTKTGNLMEYVEVFRDTTIYKIERQEINPWYLEFAFFDNIEYNKPTVGSGLTRSMISIIKSNIPETLNMSDSEVMIWFDRLGYNSFPINKGQTNELTLDILAKSSVLNTTIISKASFTKIDINS